MSYVPKEVNTESTEARVVTANLCAAHAGICGFAHKQPKVTSLSLLCSSQTLVLGWRWGQGIVTAGFEVVVLLPGTQAASMVGLSPDLFTELWLQAAM